MATKKVSASSPAPPAKKRKSAGKTAAEASVKVSGASKAQKAVARTAPVPTGVRKTRPVPKPAPSPDEHYRMVCDAAYYIAERRGFVGGDPAEDWLLAEQQIEAMLAAMLAKRG